MFQMNSHGARLVVAGACAAILSAGISARAAETVDRKVELLLAKMTLTEKIGQMVQVDSSALKDPSDVATYFLGSVLSGGDSDPADGNLPGAWRKMVAGFQIQALQTRLKIPILYGIDAVHGHNNIDGAVIFPHHIGMGAMRDPKLVEEAERVTAEEVAGTGIRWAFAPCIAVAQDESWGRTYESYSDDPGLVSQLAAASVRGLQGAKLSAESSSVLACPKHFIGDGGTQGGKDQGNTVCDEATLRRVYLPPYQAAIKAGAESIMVSFNSWNGEKMHGNKHLLTDLLKSELHFTGFLVSDWAAIDQISPDYTNDIEQSINAGLDMVMIPNGKDKTNNYVEFINDLKLLVENGKVPQSRVDDAVRRILRVKFEMGLFNSTDVDPLLSDDVGSPQHHELARECVRKSIVLLKNDNNVLPLSKRIGHLAVVGAAADDLGVQCGGWTIDWQGRNGRITHGGTTLLAALRDAVGPATILSYSTNGSNMENADAILVVVGETPYAEMKGDKTNLNLTVQDQALITKANATSKPVVLILYSGRPLVLGTALENCAAIMAAWLPGTEGGGGIADLLFGDFKFTGKLPRTWPSTSAHVRTGDPDERPLFPFGYGLTD